MAFLGNRLSKDMMRVVLVGVGLTSIAAIVYIAGPLIAFGSWHPLQNYIVREMVILLLIAGVAAVGTVSFVRKKKNAKQLAEGISAEQPGDEDVLKDRMKDALATLKNASGGKKDYLYDLPWYVIIGPPGSGKTTALVNSGLKFPLSRGATPAAVAGIGGTRYCDWWFTEDAVLIDTAGRYTTQDSDASADKQSWFAFLELLKKNRPRQPINGVLVAISLEDLMKLNASELAAHSNAIRTRLLELHQRLKIDFPVYALFTKADLIAGFVEYFGYLDEPARKQVWGATFQTGDKKRNMVGEVPVELDLLLERLTDEQVDRLQDEPAPSTRVALFGFPAQMARLKQPLFDFLNQIFEPTRYHANATLRGFYFTSGTQQGSPIDQLIGALVRSFGAEEVAASAYSGQGKSYFLTDLISKVIIGEAAWVSTDRAAVRRAMILKAAALTTIAAVTLGLSTAWYVSYGRNRALIDQTEAADREYSTNFDTLVHETLIEDRDLHTVLPALDRLRAMPAGYTVRDIPTPLAATFGLSQRERLQSSSENAYHVGLERLLRSRLIFRLEEQLDANIANPAFVYDALKVYLMLGGQHAADKELIKSWMRRDWEENLYRTASNAEGRRMLEEHLDAMLQLDAGQQPLIELDGRLIGEAQKTLGRLSIAQRAYAMLKSQAATAGVADWMPLKKGGADADRVFEAAGGQPLDTIRVPGFFTYNGFHHAFIGRMGDIAERIKNERWVLGSIGEEVTGQYDRLTDELIDLYTREFIEVWRDQLTKLRLRKLLADKPQYIALSAISAPNSPLKQLIESIRDETVLTRERPNAKDGSPAPKASAPLLTAQDRSPGASIEGAFKPFHVLVEGDASRRPIDDVIANLSEIAQSLHVLADSPSQTARVNPALQEQVGRLKNIAGRMPPPFADMLRAAAAEFEVSLAASTAGQLLTALRDQITPVCQQTIANRYPFTRGSTSEVPLLDFGRLFGPNQILDKFFQQYLAPYADTSKTPWTWRPDTGVGSTLSANTLRDFQRAAEIRDAFFQTGGNQPGVTLAIKPPALAGATAKFEVGGTVVTSAAVGVGGAPPPGSVTPVPVQWPGPTPHTAISVTNDGLGGQPSVLEKNSPWSLFRVLEAGGLSARGETASASFIVGGQNVSYQISTGSTRNPFNLANLREFKCPSGI